MSIEKKLQTLNIELPTLPKPVGSYIPVVQSGHLLFVSAQIPIRDGNVLFTGKLGADLDVPTGQEAAKLCVLNALAALKAELASLDKIKRIVRVEVYVNSAAGFTDQPKVANGASDFLVELFGPAGRHSRTAIGVAELPLNAAVELTMIAETV